VRYTFLLLCLLCASPSVIAAQSEETFTIGERFTLHSNILGEDRTYWVQLPDSYSTPAGAQRSYPVLYLLDGHAYFYVLTGVLHHLSSPGAAVETIPEMIVVAPVNTKRTRDLTPTHMASGPYSQNSGGAATFLRFIKEELFPEIELRYRTSRPRTLVGHSLGGLFVLNTFLEQPDLFQRYIAIDPSLWWDGGTLVKKLREQKALPHDPPVRLFISLAGDQSGSAAEIRAHADAIRQFQSILAQRQNASLRVRYRYFAHETHLSVTLLSMYWGLLFDFKGYNSAVPPGH
jgi:uncharacterized protein